MSNRRIHRMHPHAVKSHRIAMTEEVAQHIRADLDGKGNQIAKTSSHITNGVVHHQVNVTFSDPGRKPYSVKWRRGNTG